MLLLSSPGKDHSYGNLQNIKDKQVDQAAEKRATPPLIRRGWTRLAVRRVCNVMECRVYIVW